MLGGGGLIDRLMPGMGDALHGLGNRVIAEADASGVIKREYIWLGDRIVAAIDDADTASPNLYYVVNDYLDRPTRMRDANHVDVWKAAYRPFGEAVVTGSASLDAGLPTRLMPGLHLLKHMVGLSDGEAGKLMIL